MKCAIMQPTYLPWIGYFDLIKSVDLFIIYDSVQFEKQSWQQRNKIRNKNGDILLTIPVLYENGLNRKINEVKIDKSRFPLKKHLSTIKMSYSKSIYFNDFIIELEEIYSRDYNFLIDLNITLIKFGMKILNINTELKFSSKMNFEGNKIDAIINLCKNNNISNYISPIGSKSYIDNDEIFKLNDIKLDYHNFTHPIYKQCNFNDFISHLSFLDFVFNNKGL
jgi:hypothetical protein